jgi:hypothetical protein
VLIFVGAVVKFWVWIAVAFGAAVLFGLLLWLAFYAASRVDDRENARTAIAGRADQQHAWVLADDERGTFGDYPPAV